jgi:hypothetical protein
MRENQEVMVSAHSADPGLLPPLPRWSPGTWPLSSGQHW